MSDPHLSRRAWLRQTGLLTLLLGPWLGLRAASILAVRVWPAPDYSRVTIESDAELHVRQLFIAEPPRLAVDIEGIELNPALRELVAKVKPDDPNIAGVRIGQYTPDVVRLVLDLKQAVLPQVFKLAPVAAYRHRLVFDLAPAQPADPLELLIAERLREAEAQARPSAAPLSARPASAASTAPVDPLGDWLVARQARPAALPASSTAPSDATVLIASGAATTGAIAEKPVKAVPPSRTDRLIIVALDPGHGGEDPGAIGPAGTYEKNVVLRIALRLREYINATTLRTAQGQTSMRAFMTRDDDYFVPLQVRVQKARRVQADLFVSIHADAFLTPNARGASVFALSQGAASSSAARWMAERENKADAIGGVNLKAQDAHVQRALLDMSTTAQINDSLKLGAVLLGEIGTLGRLHKAQVEQAGFAVLKAPDIPSVLVETAFISNPEEEARLASQAYQEQLARALLRGIERYFARNPPLARNRTT